MTNKQPEFDLMVVGAGLVGASFVLALQGQGLRIVLLEKHLQQLKQSDHLKMALLLILTQPPQCSQLT